MFISFWLCLFIIKLYSQKTFLKKSLVSLLSHIGEDAAYNFINSIVKESKYCSEVMKKHFNKKLLITKEDDEGFKDLTKCWICDNAYVAGDVKVRHHCLITGKYGGSTHRDQNINVKLYSKT